MTVEVNYFGFASQKVGIAILLFYNLNRIYSAINSLPKPRLDALVKLLI